MTILNLKATEIPKKDWGTTEKHWGATVKNWSCYWGHWGATEKHWDCYEGTKVLLRST